MPEPIHTVTIIGPGLMGASLGLALKRRGMAHVIRGLGRRQETLDRAREMGAVDETYVELAPAVEHADVIVVCTPAASVPEYLDRIRPHCGASACVTDVASTKEAISRHVRQSWTAPLRFVGSHPMAGSEKFGPEHADPDLYENAVTFIEDAPDLDDSARETIAALWRGVGATVVPVESHLHDALVARTSHVPHIVAAALAQLFPDNGFIRHFVGKGFLDTTRVAEGRPEIWRDICLTNGPAVRAALEEVLARLNEVADAIETSDGARLDAYFEAGRRARLRAEDD